MTMNLTGPPGLTTPRYPSTLASYGVFDRVDSAPSTLRTGRLGSLFVERVASRRAKVRSRRNSSLSPSVAAATLRRGGREVSESPFLLGTAPREKGGRTSGDQAVSARRRARRRSA